MVTERACPFLPKQFSSFGWRPARPRILERLKTIVRTSWRGKLGNGVLCFLVLLVGLGVGLREVPECLSLLEDVSNDGELVISEADVLTQVRFAFPSRQHPRRSLRLGSHTSAELEQLASTCPLRPCVPAGPDLLHRLAVQRE
jgi:hypothetical protein